MLTVKKILCPSDFSDPSLKALELANEIAGYFRAELYILHIVADLPPLYYPDHMGFEAYADFDVRKYQMNLIDDAHRKMDSIVREKITPDLKVHKVVLQGDAPYRIVEYSKMINADLIVISTHGRTGWKLLVFGSVADKVVRIATCPVLTVHREDAES